jgi:dienelactone hydrolase
MVGDELPEPPRAEGRKLSEVEARLGEETIRIEKLVLTRAKEGEEVPAVLARPEKPSGMLVVAIHPSGKSGVLAGQGDEFSPLAAALLSKGAMVLALDPFLTGEYHAVPSPPGPPEGAAATPLPQVNKDYAGFTFGYNRALLAQRVHDVLTAIAYARGRPEVKKVSLAGLDRAGPWALLAAALAREKLERAAVELNRFRFEDLKETSDEMMLPGAVKYGGLPAFAALAAPTALWAIAPPPGMEFAREAYRVAATESALRLSEEKPGPEALAEWLGGP